MQSESFDIRYLANGRLAINGNHLVITAKSGQADDIILKGDYNYLETGDGNDIVRLGTVIDGDNNTVVQSNYNTINTGSGNDHIAYFGGNNTINTGTDTDSVMTFAANAPNNSVNGAEFNRYYAANEPYSSIDGTITTFNQGNAGDCRVLTIIENLSQKGMFSNAVSITVNDNDTYTVTFNNYNPADELYVNSTTVAKSDIEGFDNLHGDLDVVLTDYALNNLLGVNELKDTINGDYTYIEIATYNTLANYFYGNIDMAAAFYDPSLTGYSYDYQTRVEAFWDLYQNNTINNLTVAFTCETDFDLGIISGHAYTLKNLDTENGYISLINPWDNQDILNLDLDKFYSSNANIFVYGYKYNDEELVINNIETGSSYTDTYMALKGEIAGWTAANTEFTGTADVIQSGTDAQKSELIAYFINA